MVYNTVQLKRQVRQNCHVQMARIKIPNYLSWASRLVLALSSSWGGAVLARPSLHVEGERGGISVGATHGPDFFKARQTLNTARREPSVLRASNGRRKGRTSPPRTRTLRAKTKIQN